MSQPQRFIARDGSFAVDDLADAVGRDRELTRQLSRRYAECFKLFSKDFA